MARNTLICTVGTSLFSNIRGQFRDGSGISEAQHQTLKNSLENNDLRLLGQQLVTIDPTARICGAEINSIEDSLQKKWFELKHLHFLVSDTDEGQKVGKLLEEYYTKRSIALQTVEYHVIEQLQDADPKRFKIHGLRNLVREAGKILNKRGIEQVVINATGGYKAQIAIAVVLGQALGVPILYRHERFPEIIDFPPMPISFDYQLLGENATLLRDFEHNKDFTRQEIDNFDEKIRVLLDEIDVDGEPLFGLGAVGQIFLMGFRLRLSRRIQLQPVTEEDKRPPSFPDHHYPIGFKEFVEKVCQENRWIKTAHSLPYGKQRSIKGVGFDVYEGKKLVGTFQDGKDFGARFELQTTAQSLEELVWAADQLNQKYRESY